MVHFMDPGLEHDDHDMDHGIHDVYFYLFLMILQGGSWGLCRV